MLRLLQHQHFVELAAGLAYAPHTGNQHQRAHRLRIFAVLRARVGDQPFVEPRHAVPLQGVEIIAHRMKAVEPRRIVHDDAHQLQARGEVQALHELQPEVIDCRILQRRAVPGQSVEQRAIRELIVAHAHAELEQRNPDVGGDGGEYLAFIVAYELDLLYRLLDLPRGVFVRLCLVVDVL